MGWRVRRTRVFSAAPPPSPTLEVHATGNGARTKAARGAGRQLLLGGDDQLLRLGRLVALDVALPVVVADVIVVRLASHRHAPTFEQHAHDGALQA